MKQILKKSLSVFLAVLTIISSVPFLAFAQEENGVADALTDYEFDQSNALGKAFAEIAEEEETDNNPHYSITWIEMEGNVATVEFSCLTDCNLVVAVFEENGQMVASGNMEVTADMNSIEVWVEIDEMPEFFVVKAFLLDSEMGALCDEFVSEHYTKAYREFFEKTVDEFDDDLVMNLDESVDNNFFVVVDTAVVAYPGENINILTEADEENFIYTFENPGEEIRSLVVGDIFYYNTGDENFVLIKVKEISVDENKAVITADSEASFEELFSFIKIDLSEAPAESSMDTSTMDPDLEYLGEEIVPSEPEMRTFALRGTVDKKYSKKFNYAFSKLSDKLKGDISLELSANLRCYYSYYILAVVVKEIHVSLDSKLSYSLSFDASYNKKVPISIFEFSIWGVCGLRFDITGTFSAAAGISIAGESSRSVGFVYKKGKGTEPFDKKTQKLDKPTIDGSLTVSIGLELEGSVTILLNTFRMGASVEVGAKFILTGSAPLTSFADGDPVRHNCSVCFDLDVYLYIDVSFNGYLFGAQIIDISLVQTKVPILTKYLSYHPDRGYDFSNGDCPHKEYKVEISVQSDASKPLKDASVLTKGKEAVTNAKGKCNLYLLPGNYTLTVNCPLYYSQKKNVKVTKDGASDTFNLSPLQIDTIEVAQSPDITNYYVGDRFGTDGMQLLVKYVGGKEEIFSRGFSCTPNKFITSGQQSVTVRYGGKTCEYPVYVNPVTDISFVNQPSYYPGDSLFKNDLRVKLSFEDGTSEELKANNSLLKWSKTSFASGGTHEVSVTYYDKTQTFDIYVNPVTDISFVNQPSYYPGDSLFKDDLKVKINFEDGTSKELKASNSLLKWSKTSFASGGTHEVSVTYYDKTQSFDIYVNPVTDISFINQPSYYPGDSLFKDDLKVKISFEDGTSKELKANNSLLEWSKTLFTSGGTHEVSVTYYDKTQSFDIYVNPITDISFADLPFYYPGDNLHKAQFKVQITFADNFVKTLTSKDAALTLSDVVFTSGGAHNITVTYYDKTQTNPVYVVPVTDIIFDSIPEYFVGDNVNKESLAVRIVFEDNTEKTLQGSSSQLSYSVASFTEEGVQDVTVTYYDKSVILTLDVQPVVPIYIEVNYLPEKSVYVLGEQFDPSGMKLKVLHNNGSVKIAESTEFTCVADEFTAVGLRPVQINYQDLSCVLDVFVWKTEVTPTYNASSRYCLGYLDSATGTMYMWGCDSPYYRGTTVIESLLIGRGFTNIRQSAFRDCTGIKNVTVPEGVTSIAEYAFYGCTGLESISIPDSVTSIGTSSDGITGAFANCSSLVNVSFGKNSKLNTIGDTTFYSCAKLVNINIPDGVTSIGESAFRGCSNLTSVSFGENSQLTSIGKSAFYACKSLASITIPDSVTSIGESAFYSCSALASVSFGENSQLTSIDIYAFSSCKSLESIIIPNSVTSIAAYAFSYCSSLVSITIPDGVTSIGNYAFSDCRNLANITIPDSVTSIGNSVFYFCSGLTSITIPDSVTSIGRDAFFGCGSLASVSFGGDINAWCNIEFQNEKSSPLYYNVDLYLNGIPATDIVVPDGVTEILYQFRGCTNLVNITIPDSVTSIGDQAFYSCTGLTSIIIPYGVESIGNNVFTNCTSLLNITIPDTVTSIGDQAFYYCSSLESIFIPDSVTSIGNSAFSSCTNLTSVTFGDESSQLTSIGNSAFYLCENLESILIPDSVTSIGNSAFSACRGLTSVTFGENSQLTSIGNSAFYSCSNLANVYFGSDVAAWCNIVFADETASPLYYTADLYLNGIPATDIVVPDGVTEILYQFRGCANLVNIAISDSVTSIGNQAFYSCSKLTSISFGENSQLTSIGKNAFSSCRNLEDVYFGSDVAAWCNIVFADETASPLYNTADLYLNGVPATDIVVPDGVTEILYQFRGCTNLVNIAIPDSVTSIGANAFYSCSDLTSVTFDENSSLTSIGESAFYSCSNLSDISVPDSVISIGESAFYSCTGLTSISFGENSKLNNIGKSAFYSCSGLTGVSFGDNSRLQSIGEQAFYKCTALTDIIIPDSVTSIGNYAFYFCAGIKSANFDESSKLMSIGNYGFAYCTGMEIADLPPKLVYIGENAFLGCTFLQKVTVSDTVEEIGNDAFKNCNENLVVYYGGSEEELKEINGGTVPVNATVSENYQPDAFSVYTVSHSNAIVGNRYTLIAIEKSENGYDLADLVYIAVKTADSSVISFDYIPRIMFGYDVLIIGEFENSSGETIKEINQKFADDGVRVTGVQVEPTALELTLNQDGAQLTASISPANATLKNVKWQSDDPSVAYVDENGYVEVVAPGTATITVTTLDGSYTAECSVTVVIELCPDEHTWNRGRLRKEPTCTQTGERVYTCTVCGTTQTETVKKIGHRWDRGEIISSATCANSGETVYTCTACSESQIIVIAPTGKHTWDEGTVSTEATCTQNGKRVYACTVCTATKTELIPENGHSWDNGTVTTPASCHATGVLTFSCSGCTETYTQVIDIDENRHDGTKQLVNESAATCLTDGYTGDEICSGCHKVFTYGTVIKAPGHHTWDDGEVISTATCAAGGKTVYTCTVCFETQILISSPTGNHIWDEDATDTEATCTENGEKVYSCTVCSFTKVSIIPAKGHSWDNGTVTTPASCHATGVLTFSCSGCTETYTQVIDIDENRHDGTKQLVNESAATCLTDGYTGDEICLGCQKILTYGTVIKAPGYHTWNDGEIIFAATCANTGKTVYNCTVCSGSRTVITAPTGKHTWDNGIILVEPSAASDGLMIYTCTSCDTTKDVFIPYEGESDVENCKCMCHNTNVFIKIIYKIVNFFWKLFGINPVCECNTPHY